MPQQKQIEYFKVQPRVYQELCNFLASLYIVTELPKINTMITTLQNGTSAMYPPEPEKPPKDKANGKGAKKPKLESVGKEN